MLVWPNVLQHGVMPFSLRDPTKPGHRKILAMFLIDPGISCLSTSSVPPQRRNWWADKMRKVPAFGRLPVELFDQIIENVEGFLTGWEKRVE